MPYGIPNETPAITLKMETCVSEVMGKNKKLTKSNAIAICKKSIMGAMSNNNDSINFETGISVDKFENENEKWNEIVREIESEKYGQKIKITKETLDDFVNNFKNNVLNLNPNELQVNFSHESNKIACGWITDLKIDKKENSDKYSLFAKIRWNDKGIEALEKEYFRFFSAEIAFSYEDKESKKKIKNILLGAALTNIPFVSGMEAAKYDNNNFAIQPESVDAEKLNNIILQNTKMEKFNEFISSLESKDKITLSEFEKLQFGFEFLSEEEKEEYKERMEFTEKKVDLDLKQNNDNDIVKLQNDLAKSQSEIDKLKSAIRFDKTKIKVEKLFEEGKIVGEKIVDKTTQMLCNLNEKDAESWFSLLNNQSPKIDFSEKGHSEEIGKFNEEEKRNMISEKAKEIFNAQDETMKAKNPLHKIIGDLESEELSKK